MYTHRTTHTVFKTHFQWGPVKSKGQRQDFGRLGLDQSITSLSDSHFRLAYTQQIMHLKQTEQNSFEIEETT